MKISLAWKWVIASLIIESFMLSIMVIRNVSQLKENLSSQTHIRLDEQKVLLQSALSAPLAQMDYATIDAILKETKSIPNITYLVVRDSQKNNIASIGWDKNKPLPKLETNPFDDLALTDRRYDTSIPIRLSTQILGEVYLGLSTDFYIKARDEMMYRSSLIAIIELILSAILLIAISKWITNNLVKLTRTANAIANGEYEKRVELGDSKETANLEMVFNLMATNIETNIEQLKQSNIEQKKLSDGLKEQLEKNRQQNILLEQQSRMAALGEMIGNIAHQWRQPLSGITVYASSLGLKNELNIVSKKDINDTTASIIQHANYLSQTIDDFRNFIKNDTPKEKFLIQKSFIQAKDITYASLENNYITLDIVDDNEELYINGFINELTQVFINIINNAKDILIEKKIEDKLIQVKFYKQNNNIYITIHDNGGGIKDEIRDKIFDPYFTTKHKSQGTGLGLYMSLKIINEHFNGNIFVRNEEISFKDKVYTGAKFFIELIPIL
ncbi:MAG: GHKL domain-containing protein [Arcobacter sp.]|nr:GHKL domain-containing protein [Arcobacter sp.]